MEYPSVNDRVAQWVRADVRELSAYHVPDARGYVKLDAMESPYEWPGELTDAWLAELRGVTLNRYPEPRPSQLIARLREVWKIPDEHAVILGNGSDELIQMIDLALARRGAIVLSPQPSFVMYQMIGTLTGMHPVGVPLADADFSLDADAMEAAIGRYEPAVVYLAYPNNPSGNLFDVTAVRRVIEAAPGLVVVDEAYLPYARHTLVDLLGDYDNVLILRTLSKLGLAGLRLGVLIGHRAWLDELDKVRLPYNINTLTQQSAHFALRHSDTLEAHAAAVRAERERVTAALEAMATVTVYPSDANFLLFRVPAGRAPQVFEGLKAEGILVKDLSAAGGPLADCLRVTVGQPEDNARFLEALPKALRAVGA